MIDVWGTVCMMVGAEERVRGGFWNGQGLNEGSLVGHLGGCQLNTCWWELSYHKDSAKRLIKDR